MRKRNFATASSQMAVKWHEWEKDGDRYDLQYRTAGDDRVREEHIELNGITLPFDDPFWKEYLPPNGWNCRCTTVQVRKGKYPLSDSGKAIALGANATSKPKQKIFRFNPGAQNRIFPPKHPYFPKNCGNCINKLEYDKNSKKYLACIMIGQCALNKIGIQKKYDNGGEINIHSLTFPLDKDKARDFSRIYHAAELFAKDGHEVTILPNPHVKSPFYKEIFGPHAIKYPNKCPDLLIDGYFYEHKGYTTKNKDKQAYNMILSALSQSSRIIIEECESSYSQIISSIHGKIIKGKTVDEVWIAHKDYIEKVWPI